MGMPLLEGKQRAGALQCACGYRPAPSHLLSPGLATRLPIYPMGAMSPVPESPEDSPSMGGAPRRVPVITANSPPGRGGAPSTVASAQLSAPSSLKSDDVWNLGCSLWNWGHFRVGCCCLCPFKDGT